MSPLTFRKRVTVIPGFLYYNISKNSRSWTVKIGPFHQTWSSTGRKTTSADLPGPFGWRKTTRRK